MTKILTRWIEDDENRVAEIIHSYAQNGTVRWAQAWKDHPEWKEQLTKERSLGAVLVKGHEMKKKMEGGRLKKVAKAAKPEKPKSNGKRNWERWTDEQNQVIAEVVHTYAKGKGKHRYVDYAAAWAAHPDLKAVLASKSPNAIHSKGQKLLHGGQAITKSKGVPVSHRSVDLVNLADTQESIPSAPSRIFGVNGCPNCMLPLKPMNDEYAKINIAPPPFCPNCTFPLGIVRSAIRIANKHRSLQSEIA